MYRYQRITIYLQNDRVHFLMLKIMCSNFAKQYHTDSQLYACNGFTITKQTFDYLHSKYVN